MVLVTFINKLCVVNYFQSLGLKCSTGHFQQSGRKCAFESLKCTWRHFDVYILEPGSTWELGQKMQPNFQNYLIEPKRSNKIFAAKQLVKMVNFHNLAEKGLGSQRWFQSITWLNLFQFMKDKLPQQKS